MQFLPGDVVQLRSGSIVMTVNVPIAMREDQVRCMWMRPDGVIEDQHFNPIVLALVSRGGSRINPPPAKALPTIGRKGG